MNIQLLAIITDGAIVKFYIAQKLRTREIFFVSAENKLELFNGMNVNFLDVDGNVHVLSPGSNLFDAAATNSSLLVSMQEGQKMIRKLGAIKA